MNTFVRSTVSASLALAMSAGAALAQGLQAHAAIQRAIDEYLRAQTSALPGQVTFTIGAIDSRVALPACTALEIYTPPGNRLWGASSVGVRCSAPAPWTLYVNVTVRVSGSYIATARAIPAGRPLAAEDLSVVQGDLTHLPATVVTDLSQAIGKTSAAPLAGGQAVRADVLRTPLSIQQGQTVKLIATGAGFSVSGEGRALANAAEGQVAPVRTAGGQTISGIARGPGLVEVGF